MKKGTIWTILIAILVLGGFFRILNINAESLWLDEGVTYYNSISEDGYSGVWEKTAALDQSPPGMYFLYHDALNIFGENELVFRLIPVAFGVLSILFLYLLMAEMFEPEVGLIAAALLAINPFHIGFSIEARQYVLLSLEALIGMWALFKATKGEERSYGYWLVFALSAIAGLYTHNFYFFVAFAIAGIFFLFLQISEEHRWAKFLMAFLSGVVAIGVYGPWIPSLLRQLSVDRYWMADVTVMDLKNYFMDFAGGNDLVLYGLLGLSVIGFIWVLSAVRELEYKKMVLSVFSLIGFILLSLGVPFLYSVYAEPVLKIRYVVYVVPVFLALAGLGIFYFRRFSMVFPAVIFAGLFAIWTPWQVSAYPIEIGEDYRGLVEIVENDPAPILVHTPSMAHVINFYASEEQIVAPYPNSDDLTQYAIIESEEEKAEYQDYISNFESLYLVISRSKEQPGGLLYIWTDAKCSSNVKKSIDGLEVWHFTGCSS